MHGDEIMSEKKEPWGKSINNELKKNNDHIPQHQFHTKAIG